MSSHYSNNAQFYNIIQSHIHACATVTTKIIIANIVVAERIKRLSTVKQSETEPLEIIAV